jgi:2-polyprenyl-3-methyl-5-hydroxy-6-metoxy-1,4-benzoquinol methylase
MDKAGQQYWNDSWASSKLPVAMNPADMSLSNYVNRRFHGLFVRLFDGLQTPSMRLLEIGCAKSVWLPYFSKEFGFEVCGLDYSPVGCQMATQILKANGVEAEIACADLFDPPKSLLESFDVIVSFGVVEHFEDTSACISSITALLKPGGMLITSIPNMVGLNGSIQKYVNEPIYNIHHLVDPIMLENSNRMAGLKVSECDYFMATNFGVSNLAGIKTNNIVGFTKRVFLAILVRISMFVWLIEERFGFMKANKITAPYIYCVARKL